MAAALIVAGYLYFRLDDEIRRQVEHRLASHYRNLAVHVAGARFEKGRGIMIHDLAVLEPQRGSTPQPLLSVDELYLAGPVRMEDLVSGQPRVERIIIRRARLRAIRQPDGTWNVKSLMPLPKFSEQTPVLAIEDATLILQEAGGRDGDTLALRGLDLTLTPEPISPGATNSRRPYSVRGSATGVPARDLSFSGQLDTADGSLDITVRVTGLELSPELLSSVPGLPAAALAKVELAGRADLKLHVTRASGETDSLKWAAAVKVDRGQLNHPSLPHPVTDLAITLQAEPNRLLVEQLTGRLGTAEVLLACERHGWAASSPLGMAIRVVGLPLDSRFAAVLPDPLARVWERFQPIGQVDAEIEIAFDGVRWRPHLVADCHGIALTDAEKFPYPLEQATGRVEYVPADDNAPDQLRMDVTAVGGGRPVQIEVQLSQLSSAASLAQSVGSPPVASPPTAPKSHPVGWINISGTDIPLHEQLLEAMPDKGRRVVQSLRAQGAFDFRWRAEWNHPMQPKADVSQAITLKDCTIQFDRFPYPLHHVQGLLTEHNRTWQLQEVVGRGGNESTVVKCRGKSMPLGDGCQLDLVFQAHNVPLDDNLKRALAEPVQKAWAELQPQGRVDFAAHVVHETGQPAPSIAVTLRPCERSVSIEPQSFPYRLEQLDGEATWQDGSLTLRNVIAHHDRATYSAKEGAWRKTPDGGWQFTLAGFNADRLTAHRDLLIALPPRLQKTLERLHTEGMYELHDSTLSFAKNPGLPRIAAAWNVNLTCQQAALRGGIPIENMSGEIRLAGQDDAQRSYTTGELAIDTLVWKDVQFTNVRGPLWVDRTLCLFGQPASQQQGQALRRVTADAYGGSLAGDARIEHDGNPRYRLEVAAGGIDLGRFAGERLSGPRDLGGAVAGRLVLSGAGRSTHALNGSGELHIADAKIYELPVLVALLKVLKIRTPDTTAFDRCDMQFAIQGEHVLFQHLNLLGDAVSLYGHGQTNFDRKLDLVFYSLVGPADLPIPILKTIAGQVSQQGLQLKVGGTWENPVTEKEVLPSVNQVIQEIQSGIQAGAATVAPSAMRAENVSVRR